MMEFKILRLIHNFNSTMTSNSKNTLFKIQNMRNYKMNGKQEMKRMKRTLKS